MTTTPMFLFKRDNGVQYFRRAIPKNLQPFLGNKQEIVISLKSKTLDAKTRNLHHQLHMESERLLEEAKAKLASAGRLSGPIVIQQTQPSLLKRRPLWDFSESELQTIYHRWFIKEQAEVLDCAVLVFNGSDREGLASARQEVKLRLLSLRRQGAFSHAVPATLRSIIEAAGGVMEHTIKAERVFKHLQFEQQVREGLIQLGEYEQTILMTGLVPKPVQQPPQSNSEQTPSISIVTTTNTAPTMTLDDLIGKFEGDPGRNGITSKSKAEFQIVFRTLREILGSQTPVTSISRGQIKELQSICLALPAHYTHRFPKKNMREAASLATKAGIQPMSKATFNKRMTLLGSVFNYAVREQIIAVSPAQGLTVTPEQKPPGEYTFTLQQLNTIFKSELYNSFVENPRARFEGEGPLAPHLFWAPLFALFGGFRESELFNLRTENVVELDGIHCLKIGYAVGKRVKNTTSMRIVPIHLKLIELGFLEFVASMKRRQMQDLFGDAPANSKGDRASSYSKRVNRFLKKIGVKASRSTCFHSFRHNFADGMREAGVSPEDYKRIAGWSRGKSDVSEGYGGRLHRHFHVQLGKLHYEGLMLEHLALNA